MLSGPIQAADRTTLDVEAKLDDDSDGLTVVVRQGTDMLILTVDQFDKLVEFVARSKQ